MSQLYTAPRLADADGVYAEIMEAVRGLDAEASLRYCAKLALLLANHIGDEQVVREAARLARADTQPPTSPARAGGSSTNRG